MEYSIEHKRLMKLMLKFMESAIPPISLPLKRKGKGRPANLGYGSSMHDVVIITGYYIDDDGNGEVLFKEFDDRDSYEESKWEVNEMFEPMYDNFGDESFEEFVNWYFKLDITEQGNKKYNWLFR